MSSIRFLIIQKVCIICNQDFEVVILALQLSINSCLKFLTVKPGTYYNVAGWILLRPYKQPNVATKNSTEIALVSTLSISQSDFITYCCANKILLFWEFKIPKIYCIYSKKSIVYTARSPWYSAAYTIVYPLATHYFGSSMRSHFSSASAYAIACVCDTELRIYGVMCSALTEESKNVFAIFLDFCNAFDCVNNSTSIHKLEAMNTSGLFLNLLVSFLRNRKQFVV